jgi:hypothetical protein
MTQTTVKPESLSARPPALTLVDILVALTRLTLENGQSKLPSHTRRLVIDLTQFIPRSDCAAGDDGLCGCCSGNHRRSL